MAILQELISSAGNELYILPLHEYLEEPNESVSFFDVRFWAARLAFTRH